jgi:DNA-binding transcriptional regulator YiaG
MTNHPNRGLSKNPARNPKPAEVVAARERLQDFNDFGITDAQTACATLLHTTIRTWQQWEAGDRRMHPAFWELFCIKAKKNGARAR